MVTAGLLLGTAEMDKYYAISSLRIWIAIVCCRRRIAYYERNKGKNPVVGLNLAAPPVVAKLAQQSPTR
jgi:hypothetical protein